MSKKPSKPVPIDPKDKSKPHVVMQTITYRGSGPHANQIVNPQDGVKLPFDHVSDGQYILLRKRNVIALS